MTQTNFVTSDFSGLPKLIRDKIPEIIFQNEGKFAGTETLNHSDFAKYLLKKLVEEAFEVYQSKNNEELLAEIADIYEVLDTLIQFKNLSKEEILEFQIKKRIENGGFEKQLLLINKV